MLVNSTQNAGIYPNVDQFRINAMIFIGIDRHYIDRGSLDNCTAFYT